MGAPTPQFIPEAFAISAAPGDRNTIPAAPVTTQRASFDLGFPPLTMLPIVAGGKPMLGPDMNGILYMMSSHTVYAQSGQPYKFNSLVAAAISGYATGTILGSIDGFSIWYNLVNGNVTDPDDPASTGWVPLFSYGFAAISGLAGGIRTLTPAESAKGLLVLTGALGANQQIILPTTFQKWLVVNLTTGAFTSTVKTAAGTGVVVPAGGYASPTGLYGNGVDINLTFAPAALPLSVAPAADTIALRDNLAFLYAATIAGTTDNTTRVATTAFVQAVIAALTLGAPLQTWQAISVTNAVPQTNSSGHPMMVRVQYSLNGVPGGNTSVVVGGVNIGGAAASGGGSVQGVDSFIVQPGASWTVSWAGSVNSIFVYGLI